MMSAAYVYFHISDVNLGMKLHGVGSGGATPTDDRREHHCNKCSSTNTVINLVVK